MSAADFKRAVPIAEACDATAMRLQRAFSRIVADKLLEVRAADAVHAAFETEDWPVGAVGNLVPSDAFVEACWADIVRRATTEACRVESPLDLIA